MESDLRRWITLVEAPKFANGIWIDPSARQLLALAKRFSLRGTVIDGLIHVWKAAEDTHYGVHSELVGYEEDYLGENDFMLGRLDDMEDWRGGEIEVLPGIFFSGQAAAEAHPVIQSLIRALERQ